MSVWVFVGVKPWRRGHPALWPHLGSPGQRRCIMGLIIGLLVLWVVLAVVGFAVKSMLWLAIVGVVLFVATGIFGGLRGRGRGGVPR